MKLSLNSLIIASSMGFALSAHAEINSYEEYQNEMASPHCIDKLEDVLYKITHPSKWLWLNPIVGVTTHGGARYIKQNVEHNLATYAHVVGQMQKNLKTNQSNEALYQWIVASLDRHSRTTIGKPIANCIRNQINFGGNKQQQMKATQKAASIIKKLQKAVK